MAKITIKRAANGGQNYCAYKGAELFATIHGDKPNMANNRQAHWSLCYLSGSVEWFDTLSDTKDYALKGRTMQTKTAIILPHAIHGTMSAIALRLEYRGKLLHEMKGPTSGREAMLKTMREFAKNNGFTHTRFWGETVVTKL